MAWTQSKNFQESLTCRSCLFAAH